MNATRDCPIKCQIHSVPHISEGIAETASSSLRQRAKLLLKRSLSPRTKRSLKKTYNRLLNISRSTKVTDASIQVSPSNVTQLHTGDLIRVRAVEEIKPTLDTFGIYKGCAMMPDMWQYCGTQQRVLKPVEHFVDERDYRLKKTSGIVLLENLMCQGTPDYGRCDRSCYYFWRVEWLEQVE
jgi:hypothetical protein